MIHFFVTVTHVTLNINIYIYIYFYIFTYLYIFIYIYIEVELYVAINGLYLLAHFSLQDMSASHGKWSPRGRTKVDRHSRKKKKTWWF